jgi:hypothetical protein
MKHQSHPPPSLSHSLLTLWAAWSNRYDYENENEVGQGIKQSGKARTDVFIETKIPCGTYVATAQLWLHGSGYTALVARLWLHGSGCTALVARRAARTISLYTD